MSSNSHHQREIANHETQSHLENSREIQRVRKNSIHRENNQQIVDYKNRFAKNRLQTLRENDYEFLNFREIVRDAEKLSRRENSLFCARFLDETVRLVRELRFSCAVISRRENAAFAADSAKSSTRNAPFFIMKICGARFSAPSILRNRVLDFSLASSSSAENDDANEMLRRRESDLIRRAQNGDSNAFDDLVALHQNKIFNLCRWNLGNDDDAADAAQDVFVRAWRAIGRFRNDSALSTWLHRIAINVISDTATRRKRAPLPISNLQNDDEESPREIADESAEPPETALRNARRQSVQNALAQLPENQRAVLVLFDVQGHSYEELAAILQLPLGTVKSRLSRARLALRAQLEACRELWDE